MKRLDFVEDGLVRFLYLLIYFINLSITFSVQL